MTITVDQALANQAHRCLTAAQNGKATKPDHFHTLTTLADILAQSGWYSSDEHAFRTAMYRAATDTRDETLARDLFHLHDLLTEWSRANA